MIVRSAFLSSTRFRTPLVTQSFATSVPSMALGKFPSSSINDIAITAALSIARGGAEFFTGRSSAIDISRVRMRLEGLQAYGTLCALLVNACLRLYSSTKPPKKETDRKCRLALDAFLLCIVVSVLFGSYTTIVFTLLALYSKTALGRGYDAQFLEFWAATAEIRGSGIDSFMYSLVSFEMAFILSLFLRFHGARRKMLVTTACIISALSARRWSSIMVLASNFLFPLRAEVNYY